MLDVPKWSLVDGWQSSKDKECCTCRCRTNLPCLATAMAAKPHNVEACERNSTITSFADVLHAHHTKASASFLFGT
jgi:hypothetical protein